MCHIYKGSQYLSVPGTVRNIKINATNATASWTQLKVLAWYKLLFNA